MIEFALTGRGLYFRFQLAPETLVLMLVLARLWQRLPFERAPSAVS